MLHNPTTTDTGRKPDPDEPWRYVCPECKRQVNGSHGRGDTYQCHGCLSAYPMAELYDQKKGRLVSGGER